MVNRSSFGIWFLAASFLISCASSPEPVSEETPGVEAGEVTIEQSEEQKEAQPRPAEDPQGGQYFYGILQKRAHATYDEMEEELRECIRQFGPDGVVRELAVEIERQDRGAPFEVVQLEAHPEDSGDCAQELAGRYVESVGSSVFDDFDNYVISVILRPEPGGECGDESRSEETVCVALDGPAVEAEGQEEEAAFEVGCAEELVESVERSIRSGRGCLSPRNNRERALDEDRLRARAVVLGDVRVVDGMAHVVFRVHRPWARSIATCFSESLIDLEVSEEQIAYSCRATLHNFGVAYSDLPVFTFVDGE